MLALMLAALLAGVGGVGGRARATAGGKDGTGFGIRLLEAPVARRDDPRALMYIVDHLTPGETITRRVEVTSSSSKAQRIEFYAAAATVKGHLFTVAPGRTTNELSTWTSVEDGKVKLPAHGRATTEVTIRVPSTASPGERYGVVWAEGGGSFDDERGKARGSVPLVSRVGIPMYLDIGAGGEPASDFQVADLTPARDADGRPRVQARVRNTGGRALDMGGRLSIAEGPGGLSAGPFPVVMGTTLAPGDTAPVTVLLDRSLPAGPWKVDLTLRSGLVEHGVSAVLTFPPPNQVGAAVVLADSGRWGAAGLGLLLIVVAGFSVWYLRRRARLQERTRHQSHGARLGAGFHLHARTIPLRQVTLTPRPSEPETVRPTQET